MYILSIDLETTGLSRTDDITQIAIICERWLQEETGFKRIPLKQYVTFVHTSKIISTRISTLTHITNATVLHAPKMEIVLKEIHTFVNETCSLEDVPRIMVAYNGVSFDVPMLVSKTDEEWWKRLRISYLFDPLQYLRATCYDDTRLIRNTNGRPSFKLGDVHKAIYGSCIENAHNALYDADAVLNIMCDPIFKPILTTLDSRFCHNLCVYIRECRLKQQSIQTKKRRTITEMIRETS